MLYVIKRAVLVILKFHCIRVIFKFLYGIFYPLFKYIKHPDYIVCDVFIFLNSFMRYISSRVPINVQNPFFEGSRSRNSFFSEFDESKNPLVQISEKIPLRTGALTGNCDQSILICNKNIPYFLECLLWSAHKLDCPIKISLPSNGFSITVFGFSIFAKILIVFLRVRFVRVSEFVFEYHKEFENNFAGHVFIYGIKRNGSISVRSNRVYLKEFFPHMFDEVYPSPKIEAGNWCFDTAWPIDVVYTWVDGSDPKWIELWNKTFLNKDIDQERYISKNELKYSLRALCKFLPWFNCVYIVSNCKRPTWLKDHPKVIWVYHEEIFPDKSVLPNFNSHAIESCLHNIPNLSEHFIYLNDDFLVTAPSYPHDYFDMSGRTVVNLTSRRIVHKKHKPIISGYDSYFFIACVNSMELMSEYEYFRNFLSLHEHTPYPLKKSIMNEIEQLFQEELQKTRAARIRTENDISLTYFLHHHYALHRGMAVNRERTSPYCINDLSSIKVKSSRTLTMFNYHLVHYARETDNGKNISLYFKLMNREFPNPCVFG